jgi:hypothetical protein
MRGPTDYDSSPELERLNEILMKIVAYQHSLSDGRGVELDELHRQGVLSLADLDFFKQHSVTYKPHRVSDYHALDTLNMPTEGGCVFIGPGGPPLKNRVAKLNAFQPVVEEFLKLPKPKDELLLHIEFTKDTDGMGVSPGHVCFIFKSEEWRRALVAIRSVATELGLLPHQDADVQDTHILGLVVPTDASQAAAAVIALLSRGCNFSQDAQIIYSAGALDEA